MVVRLSRAQVGKSDGIDVTVKSAVGMARHFAPTWPMVMGLKSGSISSTEYAELYRKVLEAVPLDAWRWLYSQGQSTGNATILCYCPQYQFCHTWLIIDFATTCYPKAFSR